MLYYMIQIRKLIWKSNYVEKGTHMANWSYHLNLQMKDDHYFRSSRGQFDYA